MMNIAAGKIQGMGFRKGDKVMEGGGGHLMHVVAASDRLAICEWLVDGIPRQGVFEVSGLREVLAQQAQQPDAELRSIEGTAQSPQGRSRGG